MTYVRLSLLSCWKSPKKAKSDGRMVAGAQAFEESPGSMEHSAS